MKKGAIPELDHKWWSKNKAKTLKSTGLGKALKDYQIVADRFDYAKMLAALSEVKKKVAAAHKACNKTLHKDTIEALKKYPKVILAAEKHAKAKLAAEQAGGGAAPVPKQKIGKSVKIWERDISALVTKKVNPDWLDFKGYKLSLTLNEDILDVLEREGDLVTPAYMAEDAEKLGRSLVSDLIKLVQNIETASRGRSPQEVDKLRGKFEPTMLKKVADAEKTLKDLPQARWKKFVADKKAYKDYQIKAGTDFAIGVLNTTASALGIVGTGGAGLALGIVGLVRAVADLAKQCYNLYIEAETVEKALESDLKVLMKRYINAKGEAKKAQTAGETTGTVIKSILGTDAPFLATIPKCESNYDLWINKVRGIRVTGGKLSTEINKGLKACAQLEKKIAKSTGKEARKIFDAIVSARKELDKLLSKCSNMMARVTKAEGNMDYLKAMLKQIQATNSDFNNIFEKVAPRVVGLALSGATGGVGIDGAKSSLETANAIVGLVKDVELEGKAGLESILG